MLAFACAFTMFAGAAFTDQADIETAEAVDTLVALGVIDGYEDGSFRPDDTVTRAEMAKMIYIIRTGRSDASAYNDDATSFTDITNHWARGYIKYCQSMGIIAGKSTTSFDPDNTVTTQEAAKMLLVTLGYNAERAGLEGSGWGQKTTALADENGLLKDVNCGTTQGMPRQYAAQLIYNAVFAPTVVLRDGEYTNMAAVTGPGFNTYNPTIGEKYMDLQTSTAILTSVSEDNKGTYTLRQNGVGTPFTKVSKSYIDLLGQEVKVLYKDTDEVYGVYATDKNEVMVKTTIGKIDDVKTSDKKIKVDGTEYKYDDATLTVIDENYNSVASANTVDKLKYNANVYDQASTVYLVSNNADDKIDVAIVIPATVAKVTYLGSSSLTLSGTIGSIDTDDIVLGDGIAKGDYVLYTAAAANGMQKATAEKVDVITGKVTSIKDTTSVQVDGTWYKQSKVASTVPSVNSTVEMAVYGGYYYSVDETATATTADVLFVVEAGKISTGVNSGVEATVLFSDGKEETITISKVSNGGVEADATTVASAYTAGQAYAANTVVVGRMYTYTMDGSKYKLTELADTADKRAGFDKYVAGAAGSYDASEDALSDGARIADDAIVFVAKGIVDVTTDKSVGASAKVMTGKELKGWSSDYGTSVSYLTKKVNGVHTASVIALVSTAANYATEDTTYGFLTADPQYTKIDGTNYAILSVWDGSENVTMYAKSTTGSNTAITNASGVASSADLKRGNAVSFERDGTEGDVPVIVKVTKITETFAVTGIYNVNDKETDLTVTSTGVEGNNIMKVDEDTVMIYVNTDDKTGVSGSEIQLATETAIDGAYIKNIIAYTDGSFATGETAKVIFVDVANALKGEYALASTCALTAIQGATAKVTSFTDNKISLAATGTLTVASLNKESSDTGVDAANDYSINGIACSFSSTGADVAVGDTLTVVAADGSTTVYTFVA